MLSQSYEAERKELEAETEKLRQEIEVQERQNDNIERSIQKAYKYAGLEALDSYMLWELVSTIYVDAADKSSGKPIFDFYCFMTTDHSRRGFFRLPPAARPRSQDGDHDPRDDDRGADQFVRRVFLMEKEPARQNRDDAPGLLQQRHDRDPAAFHAVGDKKRPVRHDDQHAQKPHPFVARNAHKMHRRTG